MKYLVDVNVLSEATKPSPDPNVLNWLRAHEGDFVVDPVVLGELAIGIRLLAPGRNRAQLEAWFASVMQTVECLPWDAATSMRWAVLVVELRRKGKSLPVLDGMIAATALVHGLTVATRNVKDFKAAGVPVVNPFR